MSITFWLNIHFTPFFFLYNILPYFPLHFLTEKLYPLKNSLSSSYSPRSHSVYMISIFYSCCKVLKIKSFPGCKQHKENKSASLKKQKKKKHEQKKPISAILTTQTSFYINILTLFYSNVDFFPWKWLQQF